MSATVSDVELTADAILGAQDVTMDRVEVPEWGGYVLVRMMSGLERDQWEAESRKATKAGAAENIRGALAARTICDAKGALLFTAAQADALGGKSCAALERVLGVALRINRLRPEDMDELMGNSAGVAGGDGSSS